VPTSTACIDTYRYLDTFKLNLKCVGLGHNLVKMALEFCRERGYQHVFLETISVLKTARHLYKTYGITLTSSHENLTWGQKVLGERWDLDF
jgi:hypothetical protein